MFVDYKIKSFLNYYFPVNKDHSAVIYKVRFGFVTFGEKIEIAISLNHGSERFLFSFSLVFL